MEISKMDDPKLRQLKARRISLTRVQGESTNESDSVGGWEYSPPRVGERYLVYLGKGRLLRTSPAQKVWESEGCLWIETLNSIYRIRYLET